MEAWSMGFSVINIPCLKSIVQFHNAALIRILLQTSKAVRNIFHKIHFFHYLHDENMISPQCCYLRDTSISEKAFIYVITILYQVCIISFLVQKHRKQRDFGWVIQVEYWVSVVLCPDCSVKGHQSAEQRSWEIRLLPHVEISFKRLRIRIGFK